MKMPRLKTGFDPLSDAGLEIKASHIDVSMDNNPHFVEPTPGLPAVKDALQVFHLARIAAKDKSKNAVAAKKEARKILTALLIQLANYVMTAANGDVKKLISSGFDLTKKGENNPITKPSNFDVKAELTGELILKVPRQKGATGYMVHYTPEPVTPNSIWLSQVFTTSKCKITNLKSDTRYACKIAVIGPYNQCVFTDTISRMVQ